MKPETTPEELRDWLDNMLKQCTASTNPINTIMLRGLRDYMTKCKHPQDCDYPDCGTRSFPDLEKCEQPQTTPSQEWGTSIIYTMSAKDMPITFKPKWWQFWKKARTVYLKDGVQATHNEIMKNILDGAFDVKN